MDIKKEKQEDDEEDEVEDGEIRELLEKKKKLEHEIQVIFDKKEVKHEIFDVESSASEIEEKLSDLGSYFFYVNKILGGPLK